MQPGTFLCMESLGFAADESKAQAIRKLWEKHQNRKEEESK